jgi:two-component system, OmpR family, sensor histidine kinase QseC
MKLPRIASLQGRVLSLVLGLVALVWLASGALTWRDTSHELDELLDGHLAQAAALLVVQQGDTPDDDGDEDDEGVDAPTLHRYAPRVAFQVWHAGQLTMHSSNAPLTPMTSTGQHLSKGFATVRLSGEDWRIFATRGQANDVQVYVGELLESRTDILQAVLKGLLWPSLVALPALVLGLWWAVRSGVAPLRALGRTLAERRPQDLQPVVAPDAPSEMQPLLDALNGLFGRIATLMDHERRFTADAAHELRTPIAAIRAQAQVALAEAAEAPRRHALMATLEGCDRATRLVEQLLTLSRLDGATPLPAEPTCLVGVARQVLALLVPQALDKAQEISLDVAPDADALRVNGPEALLALLLRNLVDNAIRYSPAGAQVQVSVHRAEEGGGALLRVEDSGRGLGEADLSRLGERFFRVLGSGASGSGLGWSIVRRVAVAQGVAVSVGRSAALGGLSVELRWPAVA